MKRKVLMTSFIFFMLIILTFSPVLNSSLMETNSPISSTSNFSFINKKTNNPNKIKLAVYYIRDDGSFDFAIKELLNNEYNEMMNTLNQNVLSNKSLGGRFEYILEIFKGYDLVADDITLQDLLDGMNSEDIDSRPFNLSVMEPFTAHFAPIFIAGMGFGFGIGFRRMPIMERIAGNIFSAGVIGMGAILCLDIFEGTLYCQYTFQMPLLFHVLSGFIGIMMFAFDSIFPPSSGQPLTIYSNFLALGLAGFAVGTLIPSEE